MWEWLPATTSALRYFPSTTRLALEKNLTLLKPVD
jgi:hypothetical protein